MRKTALFILLLLFGHSAFAAPASEQDKIHYLLNAIATSDITFIRNGENYTPAQAKAHLEAKWKDAGDQVKTVDDFITLVATKSSHTGKPYLIKDKSGKTVESAVWLKQQLSQMPNS